GAGHPDAAVTRPRTRHRSPDWRRARARAAYVDRAGASPARRRPRRGDAGVRIARSGRALAHDLSRRLVSPQTHEARVAQPPVAGPRGEADLAAEPRLHPVHLARRHPLGERRRGALEPAEPYAEVAQHSLVEAGADLPRVPKVGAVVVPDQQRAE